MPASAIEGGAGGAATAYDPETKAAVLAALALGESVSVVARTYGVNRATVIRWRAVSAPAGHVDPEKQTDLGALIAAYLEEGLTTLAAQARHFRDPDWLRAQGADTLAINHGVLADKLVRVLAALRASPELPVAAGPNLTAAAPVD